MSKILPAGEHHGTMLHSWSSSRLFVCRIAYRAQTSYDEHGNERASMILVERGHCSKRMRHCRLDLPRCSLLFIPPRYLQSDSFPVTTTFLAAELAPAFLQGLNGIDSENVEHAELASQDARDLAVRLMRELLAPDNVSELVFEGILLTMLGYSRRRARKLYKKPPSWLALAKELLHDRALESLKLHEIAEAVAVHPAQLSREFGVFFKVTPGEYLRQLRISFATKQLEETDAALADVAASSGFADQAHFSKLFQRRMGVPPGQYRLLMKPNRGTQKGRN